MDEVTRRIRGDKRFDLSPAMVRALRHAADGDGRLYFVDGTWEPSGWWYQGLVSRIRGATVHALWRRGYLEPVGERWGSTPRPRKLTQKARDFLAQENLDATTESSSVRSRVSQNLEGVR